MSETTFIIARILKKNPLEIEAGKDKDINHFGADSLNQVEIVIELEEYFNISIPDSAAERLRTPRDFERAARNLTASKL